MKRTPLKRTPMRRRPARSGPIPPEARWMVDVRSRGRCEGRLPGVCTGMGQEVHHRRSRGVGKTPHDVSNLLALCSACHHHVTHVSPRAGFDRGIVVSRNAITTPSEVPVLYQGRVWVLLDDEGGRTEVNQ